MGIIKNTVRFLRKSSTGSEKIFWNLVRKKQFINLRFQRQYPIKYLYNNVSSFFVADFYCHALNLIIEIDGSIHSQVKERDEIRDFIVNTKGFNVLRVTDKEVINEPQTVLNKINAFIKND